MVSKGQKKLKKLKAPCDPRGSALIEAVVEAFPRRTDVAKNAVVLELFDAVVDTGQ